MTTPQRTTLIGNVLSTYQAYKAEISRFVQSRHTRRDAMLRAYDTHYGAKVAAHAAGIPEAELRRAAEALSAG